MPDTTATVAKKKKKQRSLANCPKLSERDQRLIAGFLIAYSTDVETASDGDKALMDAAPDMQMFRTRYQRWENILSGIREMMLRIPIRQWWLKGSTPEQIERMEWEEQSPSGS